MTVPSKSHQGKEQEEGTSGGDGEKIQWKLCEVNIRTVSRGQNGLIGKLMAAGDEINIRS